MMNVCLRYARNEPFLLNTSAPEPEHNPVALKIVAVEKSISVVLHICIMIGFEIFFFFQYIIYMERQLFKDKIYTYIQSVDTLYESFVDKQTREIVALSVQNNPMVAQGINALYQSYQNGKHMQHKLVQQLQSFSFALLGGGVALLCILVCIGYPYRTYISWKGILLENIGMVVGLGCFQFVFFTFVILKYNPISDAEIKYWLGTSAYAILADESTDN